MPFHQRATRAPPPQCPCGSAPLPSYASVSLCGSALPCRSCPQPLFVSAGEPSPDPYLSASRIREQRTRILSDGTITIIPARPHTAQARTPTSPFRAPAPSPGPGPGQTPTLVRKSSNPMNWRSLVVESPVSKQPEGSQGAGLLYGMPGGWWTGTGRRAL